MQTMDTVRTMFTALGREPVPSDADLEDIGLSRIDYQTLNNSPTGARERMVFMAERFGVSEKQLKQEHWRAVEMARTCAQCGVTRSCERFRTGRNPGFEPGQCPNAPQFTELSV